MSDETIYRIGLEQENAELHRINTELNWVVQDLIAELRKQCDIDPYFDDEYCLAHEAAAIDGMVPCSGVQQAHEAAADRAETRLREVQGE